MKSLASLINYQQPRKIALCFGETILTYQQLKDSIYHFSASLKNQGVGVGDRVALIRLNPKDLLVAYYGCTLIGAIAVPVPYVDAHRVEGAIKASNAKLAVDDISLMQEGDVTITEHGTSEEALVIFTSGTTSDKLKGVRLANQGINDICLFMNTKMDVNESIVELVFAPLDHAFAFGRCHSVLAAGGTVVLAESLKNPMTVSMLFSKHQCNALSTSPSVLSVLLRLGGQTFEQLKERVRWLQTGAMRFDKAFREQLCGALPNTRMFLHYGLSEAMRVTFFEINRFQDKLHTEGPASDCCQLKIVDDSFNEVPAHSVGRIAIKGTNLCLGYLDDELWRSQVVDGWFITSDLGSLDELGFLVFAGRSDDVVNCNGVLIHPDEIESKLVGLITGNHFSVLGIVDPNKLKDTIIVLCIEGDSAITLRDVANHLANTDANLVPSELFHLPSLPKTRTGKTNRAALVKEIQSIMG